MESIGAEVGQKMRSAIKAKLLELDCYVDDELPDYIMVMVANKRSRSQMTEDLNLFLSKKTSTFVNWLQIVLKKLREVSVTNPEVYKKVAKRKSLDTFDEGIKEKKTKYDEISIKEEDYKMSLTDNLPITGIHFSQKIGEENPEISNFTGVSSHTDHELEENERRFRLVKNHLVTTEGDVEQSFSNGDMLQVTTKRFIDKCRLRDVILDTENEDTQMRTNTLCERKARGIITFENDKSTKKISIKDRLGERIDESNNQKRIKLLEFRREEEKLLGHHQDLDTNCNSKNRQNSDKNEIYLEHVGDSPTKNNIHKIKSGIFKTHKFDPVSKHGPSRLEVMSKVYVPLKKTEPDQLNKREVKSKVQVKPRIIPSDAPQPNNKLLLKAIAEAQKSIEQTSKPKIAKLENVSSLRKEILPKNTIPTFNVNRSSLSHGADVCIPNTAQESSKYAPNYISSMRSSNQEKNGSEQEDAMPEKQRGTKQSANLRIQERTIPPIVFDKLNNKLRMRTKKTENTLVRVVLPSKMKERCKFWPVCRQGKTCEFVHPDIYCEKFPHCKYGDKCLYLHPLCKFGNACTKRKCPFSH